MKETVEDFWRMLLEFKCKTVVMLCNTMEEGQESSYLYWPMKVGEEVTYGNVNVTLQSSDAFNNFTVRKFMIGNEKVGYFSCTTK